MREPLTIAVAQPLCVPYDIAANAATHAATIRSAGARVVVFPELSLTGYELDAPAITADDPRLAPIVEACRRDGVAGAGGRPGPGRGRAACTSGRWPSTARVPPSPIARCGWAGRSRSGSVREARRPCSRSTAGGSGLAICKDTGIPQHAADTAALGIDAYVAGVLESTDDVAVPETRARRIAADHHVWVATASFAGSTGGGYDQAAGCSGIWSPDGVEVARQAPRPAPSPARR